MIVERPHKSYRRESMVVGFSDEDYAGVSLPYTDAIVVTLQVANHRIFVDNGSSADILYWSAFQHMEISPEKVIPATCPLVGFAGEQVQPVGSIELLVTAGDYPTTKTIMVKFLLIDRPSAYNAILGRTTLNDLKAITSTPHLKIKFPTLRGIGEVKEEQSVARQCYNVTMKGAPSRAMVGKKASNSNYSRENQPRRWKNLK
jgi:hypothetical protein